MAITLYNKSVFRGKVHLPASKSISNRVLVIDTLAKEKLAINNCSKAEDTVILKQLLADTNNRTIFDVGKAGTAFRFLTAYFSSTEGERVLTGDNRMLQRPIKPLVDALQSLGVKIQYLNQEGYPPLKIYGSTLSGGVVRIDSSVSSQFISALLLVAPSFKNGLEVELIGNQVSKSYVLMTLDLMRYFGADWKWKAENKVIVYPKPYKYKDITIEADWSSASYFYSAAALAKSVDCKLIGLSDKSLQGDCVLVEIYGRLGVETIFEDDGVRLLKKADVKLPEIFSYDFTDCPDLAQTVACTCVGLGISAEFSGLKTLVIKETNRLSALKSELEKLGCKVQIENEEKIIVSPSSLFPDEVTINTYYDHRMAMAFAPLTFILPSLRIDDESVVRKSFPDFWICFEGAVR